MFLKITFNSGSISGGGQVGLIGGIGLGGRSGSFSQFASQSLKHFMRSPTGRLSPNAMLRIHLVQIGQPCL